MGKNFFGFVFFYLSDQTSPQINFKFQITETTNQIKSTHNNNTNQHIN